MHCFARKTSGYKTTTKIGRCGIDNKKPKKVTQWRFTGLIRKLNFLMVNTLGSRRLMRRGDGTKFLHYAARTLYRQRWIVPFRSTREGNRPPPGSYGVQSCLSQQTISQGSITFLKGTLTCHTRSTRVPLL